MARRRRVRRKDSDLGSTVIGLAVVLVAVMAIVVLQALWQWATTHRLLVTGIGVLVAVAAGLGLVQRVRSRRAAEERRAERERAISSTDKLSGPEFEQWTARLLARTGFRDVAVHGGAGDLGADITARAPDGRRAVIQCKRFRRNVSSPDVQRFAGTCRAIHQAELAVFITTAGFSMPARALAVQLDIVLVDREMLSEWAANQRLPAPISSGKPPQSPAA